MNSKPFRLLNLPYLVRKNVLEIMGFIELYLLSHCSKISKFAIKNELRSTGNSIQIIIDNKAMIAIHNSSFQVLCQFELLPLLPGIGRMANGKLGIGEFKNVFSCLDLGRSEKIKTFWNDIFEGCKTQLMEILYIFSIPIESIQIDIYKVRNNFKLIIEWINSLRPEVARINGSEIDYFCNYLWILENLKPSRTIWMGLKPYFIFEKKQIDLEAEIVIIDHGQWMNLELLLSMENLSITVRNSSLTDIDINLLLKSLKVGSCPKLQVLVLNVNRRLTVGVLEGIEFTRNILYEFKLEDGGFCTLGILNNGPVTECEIKLNRVSAITDNDF